MTERIHIPQWMLDQLKGADLEKGVINGLRLGQVYALFDKGLIQWRANTLLTNTDYTTLNGTFPRHNNVRLTDFGLIVARRQQHKVKIDG